MDKRMIKTRKAIYDAFTNLLNMKDYNDITIEDILTEANISRSTFYSHYKTKEELLISLNDHIFNHVFSHSLTEEKTHDFSKSSIFDYSHLITHILYHLHDDEKLVKAIVSNQTRDIFYSYIRKKIEPVIKMIMQDATIRNNAIPLELNVKEVVEAFVLCVDYWCNHDFTETPEKITGYFFSMINQK